MLPPSPHDPQPAWTAALSPCTSTTDTTPSLERCRRVDHVRCPHSVDGWDTIVTELPTLKEELLANAATPFTRGCTTADLEPYLRHHRLHGTSASGDLAKDTE